MPDWARYTRRADILVAAAGVPGIVQPEHVKPGAVVIGAGVRYDGRRLLPDVDEACAEVAGAITPGSAGSVRPPSRCCSATPYAPPNAPGSSPIAEIT